ncbi:PQQ-binding-like beta-propeller repeat protein [Natrialbaceae archaeon AArc-T1-2]|uniref:outer membrane protein assembly factor BamB family protein n=1 Tax=Natrialbaceae archaeon AArc-T1-2 TaxID=3053904 RepID=UPI00255AE502|nr:PQQ-binding-like beta-propeller repeat protein [Natrialbaceae archaeon AArc-T1-2]WIV66125.1 PQQ-binding-like beta-propeller repeat protein [Natrialbaceae archaeon AArc-T1-2]
MNERGRASRPRAVGRRRLLRSGAAVGGIGLAGCMQPLLEEGEAAEDGEPAEEPGDGGGETPDTDAESDDGVEVVEELHLEPAWEVDRFGSSVVTHDGQFLTQVGERQLTALDADGGVQWEAAPLERDDHSYALPGGSGNQDGVSVLDDVRYVGTLPHGDHAGRVFAYEYDGGSTRFEHEPDESVSIRHLTGTADGVVYYGSDPENDIWLVRALEYDGETRWTIRLEDDGDGPWNVRNLVAGDGLVIATDELAVGVYDLADGSLVETIDLDPVVREAHSSNDSLVYLRTDNGDRLTALERSSFDLAWEQDLERTAVSPTALVDGVIYAGSEGGFVHAYDAADGTLLWESPRLAGRIDTRPTVGEFVWATDDLGTIYALERDDGTVRYREDYREGLDSSTAYNEVTIAAIDGTVLIGESGQAYRVRSA